MLKLTLIAITIGTGIYLGMLVGVITGAVLWIGYEIKHPIEDTNGDGKIIALDEHEKSLS